MKTICPKNNHEDSVLQDSLKYVCKNWSTIAINKIIDRGVFVLWTRELMNQFLKNHQLNKAEIGATDESISDWISVLQDTFSSM